MSISTVTSESLQLKLRQLLPSQQGFGTDLSASDTIIPIIDLTSAAEGSDVSESLQTALAYGNATSFSVANTTTAIENSPGFYRFVGTAVVRNDGGSTNSVSISITDGVTPKTVWSLSMPASGTEYFTSELFDLVLFINAGETINIISNDTVALCVGSSRQVATNDGTLVPPTGFSPQ